MKSNFEEKREKIETLERVIDLTSNYSEKLNIQYEINRLKNE